MHSTTQPQPKIVIPPQTLENINHLRVDGDNPNRMTDRQHASLKSSIEKYGFIVPIITNKDLLIADGEQRWFVAKDIGMQQVPVIKLPVEDVDRRLLRQVLNKLRGEHELIADAYEFERIIQQGHEDDLKHLLDLSDGQIGKYLNMATTTYIEEEYIPDYLPKTDIKTGDMYVLGNHRLMCGDATNPKHVRHLIGDTKITLILTDPPYNVRYGDKDEFLGPVGRGNRIPFGYESDDFKNPDADLLRPALTNIAPHLASHNAIYVFYGGMFLPWLDAALRSIGAKTIHILVWRKNTPILGRSDYRYQHELIAYTWIGRHRFYGKNQTSVWDYDKPRVNAIHPTMKPVMMLRKAITNSTRKGMYVVDVFGGSGSTLIACEQTGRHCYMMEIDPRYCQVIIDRWQAYTDEEAVCMQNG